MKNLNRCLIVALLIASIYILHYYQETSVQKIKDKKPKKQIAQKKIPNTNKKTQKIVISDDDSLDGISQLDLDSEDDNGSLGSSFVPSINEEVED